MANLLPKEERIRFEREYLYRLVIVGLSFFIALGIFGFALLLPSYFLSKSKEASIRDQSEFLQKAVTIREQDVSSEFLARTKQKLIELDSSGGRTLPTSLIDTIIKNKESTVTIDALYYTRSAEEGSVRITGRAASRASLLSFSDRLQQEEVFSKVDLPVSHLAKETNIIFSMTLSGKF
ncbi:hypothetical protein A3D62_00125 [Candidatus Kaiserbacteria bacterium RIFCSPHIGHO2_02_FULL_49_11]|uniref:Uncharacterized protein n=1 Tax=Candidatus Kaiserbacteria bacterium RIFCSPHIGHO2_02_FULL_49_11 TaxID=1798489 RepID=A0A1F6D1K8_9BACT|nr:MAG: hypothetical protein A3D62_00125 [Candidatus Kaiserbacteria bacterium RIFCSPHIGHO2_02_FULL_49_11]